MGLTGLSICYKCKYLIGIMVDGKVRCEKLGIVEKPMIHCRYFERPS